MTLCDHWLYDEVELNVYIWFLLIYSFQLNVFLTLFFISLPYVDKISEFGNSFDLITS